MQLAQSQNQITYDEVQVRDIAQLYIRIQENTQFLTNIVRHQHGRSFQVFSYDIPNIDIKSFFNLIVQSAYLLYTCYVKKVALFFSKNFYLTYQKQGTAEVILEFILEKQWLRFDQNKRKQIQMSFNYVNTFKYQNAYAQNVLLCIKNNLQKMTQHIKRQKQKKLAADRNLSRPLDSLDKAFGLLSSISQKEIKPKALISCLQQTEVFRTYSYLLKTLNSSLYQATRKTGKFQEIIQQIKRKQLIFNQNFVISRQDAIDNQSLQYCLQDFFSYLIGRHLIQMQVSTKSKSTGVQTTKQKNQVKLGTFQVFKHGKYQDRVCLWKILVEQKKMRQFNQKILIELTQGDTTTVYSSYDKQHKIQNLFYIQYMAKRNLISVQYISNVEVNVQSTDALIYHCSNMMLQLNNVVVQHIQRQATKNNKRKARVLAFKLTQYLNPKQNPFISIMLMIDRAMIYGKVCEPEIMKKITKVDDYTRFNVVGKRINHLSNLFIKKVRRLYENIGNRNKQN